MKHIVISTFIFPWEIDELERLLIALKEASFFVSDCKYTWSITLDLSDNRIDWNDSKIPKEFFSDKFATLKRYCDWCEPSFNVNTNADCLGCADQRRNDLTKYKECDAFIWLDTDMFFPKHILGVLSATINQIQDKHFLLTPEIIRYWDSSWDVITNKKFLSEPNNQRDTFDMLSVDAVAATLGEPQIETIQGFKFGGGWFTCISKDLLTLSGVPDFIDDYGPDDTWLSYFSDNYNKFIKPDIKQYVMRNVVVTENGKRYTIENYYKKFLKIKVIDIDEKKRKMWEVFGIKLQERINQFKK